MSQLKKIVPLLAVLALPLACKDKAPPPEQSGPRPKNKQEALEVFDKHKDTYVRCEKLRQKAQPSTSTAETKPLAQEDLLELQTCQAEYWKVMKRDMGPYEQSQVDEWYAEWKKGVKLE